MAAFEVEVINRLMAAAETGDIEGLYRSIKEAPCVLGHIEAIPFVETPLHTTASMEKIHFAVEILRLKPSFGRKLNPDGLSSLHLALINHKFDMAKRLIKLDKELIRVKGREGETPLHFIVKSEGINGDPQPQIMVDNVNGDPKIMVDNINGDSQVMVDRVNADQSQQRVDDRLNRSQEQREDSRIDILAEFLLACPESIEDLTIRDETAFHIAVKTKNKRAVEVILGLIQRINKKRVVAKEDDQGNTALHIAVSNSQLEMVKLLVEGFTRTKYLSKKNSMSRTALDIALLLGTDEATSIVNSLRGAGALTSSSFSRDHFTLAKYFSSPMSRAEKRYRFFHVPSVRYSMEQRNIGVVVAALIATTTFQAVLSPPGGVGGANFNLITSGSKVNATVSSTNKLFAFFVGSDHRPLHRIISGGEYTYGDFFLVFYLCNTLAFVFSTTKLMLFLPFRPFLALHFALIMLMYAYGVSFDSISPSIYHSLTFSSATLTFACLVYFWRALWFLNNECVDDDLLSRLIARFSRSKRWTHRLTRNIYNGQ